MSAVRVLHPSWQVFWRPSEYSILSHIELCRPLLYSILRHGVLCRPSRCLRKLRKYSVGRESISADVDDTLSAVGVFHPAA